MSQLLATQSLILVPACIAALTLLGETIAQIVNDWKTFP